MFALLHNLQTLPSFCGGPGAFGVPDDGVTIPLPFPVFGPNELGDANDKDEAFKLFELEKCNRK